MRRLLFILLILLGLHVLLWLAVTLAVPTKTPLDNGLISFKDLDSRWYDQPQNIVWGREAIRGTKRNVVIFGVSTSRAFRPEWINPRLPEGYAVHNVFLPGGNITAQAMSMDLFREALSDAPDAGNWYVLPICYTGFRPDRLMRGEERNFILEETRGLTGDSLRLYGTWRTYMLKLRHLIYDLTYYQLKLRSLGGIEGRDAEFDKRIAEWNEKVLDEEQRQAILDEYRSIYGSDEIGEEQFKELEGLIRSFAGSPDTLVLVNMPVAPWFRERSPYPAYYDEHVRPALEMAGGMENVLYLDYGDTLPGDGFIDSLHIKPREYERVSTALGRDLARLFEVRGVTP